MERANEKNPIRAPVVAIDLGEKRVGIAVSDALSISITRLDALACINWKQLLRHVATLIEWFDAQTVVIGLRLMLNGSLGASALKVRLVARNFETSMRVRV